MPKVNVEQPDPELEWNKRTYIKCLIKAPLFFAGMLFISHVFYAFYLLLNRDIQSTEAQAVCRIQEENDIPVYNVDAHPIQLMANPRWPWIVANWIVLVALTLFWGVTMYSAIFIAMIGWMLHQFIYSIDRRLWIGLGCFISIGVYITFLVRILSVYPIILYVISYTFTTKITASQRENHIVSRIESITSQENIESGCLIIGYQHISRVKSLIDATDIIVSHVFSSNWLRKANDEEFP